MFSGHSKTSLSVGLLSRSNSAKSDRTDSKNESGATTNLNNFERMTVREVKSAGEHLELREVKSAGEHLELREVKFAGENLELKDVNFAVKKHVKFADKNTEFSELTSASRTASDVNSYTNPNEEYKQAATAFATSAVQNINHNMKKMDSKCVEGAENKILADKIFLDSFVHDSTKNQGKSGSGRSRRNGMPSTNSKASDLTSEEESLFYAISLGKIHRVASVMDKVEDFNVRSADLKTPLIHACSATRGEFCTQVIRMLLKQKHCDINAKDSNGCTALMYTCQTPENIDAARVLARNPKCNANIMDESGCTALMHAILKNNSEAVLLLLTNPQISWRVDVDVHNLEGLTALGLAIQTNNAKFCKILVNECSADTSSVHDLAKLKTHLAKS